MRAMSQFMEMAEAAYRPVLQSLFAGITSGDDLPDGYKALFE